MNVCEYCGWGEGRHARSCPVPTTPSVTELLGPKPDRGYLRAVASQKAARDPRSHPPIACTAADIDAGMFHMEHGHYPTGEEPA